MVKNPRIDLDAVWALADRDRESRLSSDEGLDDFDKMPTIDLETIIATSTDKHAVARANTVLIERGDLVPGASKDRVYGGVDRGVIDRRQEKVAPGSKSGRG